MSKVTAELTGPGVRLEFPMQQPLIKLSPEELAGLREQLSKWVGSYIRLEDEKKEFDKDLTERMTEAWEEIKGLRARIKEAEDADR